MRWTSHSILLLLATLATAAIAASTLGACADGGALADDAEAGADAVPPDDEYGMEGPLTPTPPPGKEDSQNRKGLAVATNTTRTQVWTARNRWEETTTAAARKAGIAWPADSGLTWDQKYVRWLEAMAWTTSEQGYQTVVLTTPWGKSLPSPALECAEMSLFLRTTFAAWYELPLFFEAVDENGKRVYFSHNGVRTAAGRYANTPEFAIVYSDQSDLTPAQYEASWPHDQTLRGKRVYGGEDVQNMIAPGAVFGAYLDEIHLNKRAGYLTLIILDYLGSANLADAANTYNVVPESVRAGDFLIERWQKVGIGHTLVVKEVAEIGEGNKDVVLISGSMPRRQGKRESGVASKSYFTSAYTGGPGTNYDGDEYVKLGGGLKRFRVTKNIGGYWTNTWMEADEAHWINSTDWPRLSARPARFELMLGQVSPEQLRTELLAQIADSRQHLASYPASCAARERRERAFEELYDLSERTWGTTRAAVDAQYRQLSDYVLAELVYGQSKTCCWNSTTPAMFDVVIDFAEGEQEAADAQGICVAPTVFMNQADGYQRWAAYAASTGRGAAWRAWSEDESCAQRNVARDTEGLHQSTAFCPLPDSGGGGGCSDALEPNDASAAARAVSAGSYDDLEVCSGGDEDWFALAAAATVRIEFTHSAGDLDMEAYNASGTRIGQSQGTSNSESLTVPAGTRVRVYGYQAASGAYRLVVQ